MSLSIETMMTKRLFKREQHGNRRTISGLKGSIDFSSNDYLGLSRHPQVISAVVESLRYSGLTGSTASRLSSGNSQLATDLEKTIAAYHGAEEGLLFSSGYLANIGLLPSLLSPNDLCLFDERIHMSFRDGLKLTKARAFGWRHNDLSDLEDKLAIENVSGRHLVVIESVYSCDGSSAPLKEIAELCDKYRAWLIVDEAHATGILGPQGRGLSYQIRQASCLLATVHPLGKAIGANGAIILGSSLLKSYLLNFCNTQIYTTMLPYTTLHAIDAAYTVLPLMEKDRERLHRLIDDFKFKTASLPLQLQTSETPIQSILMPNGSSARELSLLMQQEGLDVRPMTFPTVPHGGERLRICLHAFNTVDEIDFLIETLRKYL